MKRFASRASEEAVVAASAGDVLDVLEDVVELSRCYLAVVGDAVQRDLERSGARCVGRRVDGASSRQHVRAEPAVEAVGSAEAEELIRSWAADQNVGSRAAPSRFDVGVDVVVLGGRSVVGGVVDGDADARRALVVIDEVADRRAAKIGTPEEIVGAVGDRSPR